MKASSMVWEIEINISDEEIARLEKEVLNGEIKVHDNNENLGAFPLEVKVGTIDERQLYAKLQTVPPRAYIDKVKKYIITLSQEGYKKLKEDGATGDRMANNPSCKILIKKKNPSIY